MPPEQTTDKFAALQTGLDQLRTEIQASNGNGTSAESQLRRLLELHEADEATKVEAAKQAKLKATHKRRTTRQVLGIVATLATAAGLLVGYFVTAGPPVVQASDVQHQVERLEEITIEQQVEIETVQVQVSDGFDYIGRKIDRAHPEEAGQVDQPDSLKAARKRKRNAAVRDRLFDE